MAYEMECDERAEIGGASILRQLAREVGIDKFVEMGVKLSLPHEERWRREIPDHPMLPIIDQWRAKKEQGFS
ncbi:MAG: hypothetical protein ABJF01_24765 [bacterium]